MYKSVYLHRILANTTRRSFFTLVLFIATIPLFINSSLIVATSLPPGFVEETVVAKGIDNPTSMVFLPDNRLLVTEQTGSIRIVNADGTLQPYAFHTLVENCLIERGVLGAALDPHFSQNGYIFVYYTVHDDPNTPPCDPTTPPDAPAHNRLVRLKFSANDPRYSDDTETTIVDFEPLFTDRPAEHNGGLLQFLPDGTLLIAIGDDADNPIPPRQPGDPPVEPHVSQQLGSVKGKVLRIIPSDEPDANPPYTIPTDNPWYADPNVTGINKAIYAIGLRNPFNGSLDSVTGRMFIGDVGQDQREEVDELLPGKNYGWPKYEGNLERLADSDYVIPAGNPAPTPPILDYQHFLSASGSTDPNEVGCALVAGEFYRSTAAKTFPSDYDGDYFFADYCNKWIKRYDQSTGEVTLFASDAPTKIVDLEVGPDGALYVLSRELRDADNKIQDPAHLYRIRYVGGA